MKKNNFQTQRVFTAKERALYKHQHPWTPLHLKKCSTCSVKPKAVAHARALSEAGGVVYYPVKKTQKKGKKKGKQGRRKRMARFGEEAPNPPAPPTPQAVRNNQRLLRDHLASPECGQLTEKQIETAERFLKYNPQSSSSAGIVGVFKVGQLNTLSIPVTTESSAFISVVMSVVSQAIYHGWLGYEVDPNIPYYCYIWHVQALINAAKGGLATLPTAPHWLALLIQSVKATTVSTMGGHVSYNFDVEGTFDQSNTQVVGPATYGRNWFLGRPYGAGGPFVNTIPVLDNPLAYTETKGETAAQSLWKFLTSRFPDHEMHRLVSTVEENAMTGDPSAFAAIVPVLGGAVHNGGSFRHTLASEVPVHRPMFSVFNVDPLDHKRSLKEPRNYGGDGMILGGNLLHDHEDQLASKAPPHIKYIDFNHMVATLTQWVFYVQQAYTSTTEFQDLSLNDQVDRFEASLVDSTTANPIQCPLTLQEMELMLRCVAIVGLGGVQTYTQGTFPRQPEPNEDVYAPLICGGGTTPHAAMTEMMLPRFLKENILALSPRELTAGRGGDKNPTRFLPCLVVNNNDRITQGDWNLNLQTLGSNTSQTVSCFRDNTGESYVDIIDGTATYMNAQVYLEISNTEVISRYARIWNKWVRTMGSHYTSVDTISADKGIDCLWQLHRTDHTYPYVFPIVLGEESRPHVKGCKCSVCGSEKVEKISVPVKPVSKPAFADSLTEEEKQIMKQKALVDAYNSKRSQELTVQAPALVVGAIFDGILFSQTSSTNAFLKEPWDLIGNLMIRPISFRAGTASMATRPTRVAGYLNEFFSMGYQSAETDKGGAISFGISEKLATLASTGVRDQYALEDPLTEFYDLMDSTGSGGMIADIVATLGGVLLPGAGPLLNSIATVVPF